MASNLREVSYFICTVPVEREEYTLEIKKIMHRFFGEDAKIIPTKFPNGSQNFEVKLPVQDDLEALELRVEKVHNLCRIKVHALGWIADPLPKPALPKKDRPDTIRVQNIPIAYSKKRVEQIIQKDFGSKPKIHSFVLSNKEYQCATVTFPGKEFGFPIEQLQRIKCLSQPNALKIEYDADFLGFTTLYNASPKGWIVHVDIVAVVGLGTHAFGTFRSMAPGSHQMWLRDFLPQDIPNSRILLYGYASPVSRGESIQTIQDISTSFLYRLAMLRRDTSTLDRPIIFIGQSLGGLIIQESLLRAVDSPSKYEQRISRCWHGLVGFGIPIAGLNNSSLIEAAKSQPNKVLIDQLCLDRENGTPSNYLKDLKERFERCCVEKQKYSHAPKVTYFWEKLYSRPRDGNGIEREKLVMVAGMEIPGAVNLPLYADHSGMVKYDKKSNLNYEDVKNNIKGMVESLVERRRLEQSGRERSIFGFLGFKRDRHMPS